MSFNAFEPLAWTAPPIEFVSNPLADYLHLLLYRAAKPRLPVFVDEGFDQLPRLEGLVAVSELVAAAGVLDYRELDAFIADAFAALPETRVRGPKPRIISYSSEPPTLADIRLSVQAGKAYWPKFLEFWQAGIAPEASKQIEAWREQDRLHQPLRRLLEIHRLPLRSDRFIVAAMPYHPAGSANYSPAGVYSSLFRTPDLGRVLGHEASHLLWSEAVGTEWKRHRLAGRVVTLAQAKDVDVEEAMCLLIQTVLSQEGGVQPANYRVSSDVQDPTVHGLLAAWETSWPDYLSNPGRWPTLIDYVLETSLTVLT